MEAKRYHYIEHEILRFVLQYSDHLGYQTDLPQLATFLRETLPDIQNPELVDSLKRLRPKYLTLWKWSYEQGRAIEYPAELSDDNEFFYRHNMLLRRTPETDPYLQELAALFPPQESDPPKKTYGFLP